MAIDWQRLYTKEHETNLSVEECSVFKVQGYIVDNLTVEISTDHVFRTNSTDFVVISSDDYIDSDNRTISYRLLPPDEDSNCSNRSEVHYYSFDGKLLA